MKVSSDHKATTIHSNIEKNENIKKEKLNSSVFISSNIEETQKNVLRNMVHETGKKMQDSANKSSKSASLTTGIGIGGVAVGSTVAIVGAKAAGMAALFGPVGLIAAGLILAGTAITTYGLHKKESSYKEQVLATNFENKQKGIEQNPLPIREGIIAETAGFIFSSELEDAKYRNKLPNEKMLKNATKQLADNGVLNAYFIQNDSSKYRANHHASVTKVKIDISEYIGDVLDKSKNLSNLNPTDNQRGYEKTEYRNAINKAHINVFKEYADLADNIEEAPQTQSQMQALENLLAACSSDNHQKAIHYFDTNGDNEFTKDDIDNIKKDINGDGIIDDKDKNILLKLLEARKAIKEANQKDNQYL